MTIIAIPLLALIGVVVTVYLMAWLAWSDQTVYVSPPFWEM